MKRTLKSQLVLEKLEDRLQPSLAGFGLEWLDSAAQLTALPLDIFSDDAQQVRVVQDQNNVGSLLSGIYIPVRPDSGSTIETGELLRTTTTNASSPIAVDQVALRQPRGTAGFGNKHVTAAVPDPVSAEQAIVMNDAVRFIDPSTIVGTEIESNDPLFAVTWSHYVNTACGAADCYEETRDVEVRTTVAVGNSVVTGFVTTSTSRVVPFIREYTPAGATVSTFMYDTGPLFGGSAFAPANFVQILPTGQVILGGTTDIDGTKDDGWVMSVTGATVNWAAAVTAPEPSFDFLNDGDLNAAGDTLYATGDLDLTSDGDPDTRYANVFLLKGTGLTTATPTITVTAFIFGPAGARFISGGTTLVVNTAATPAIGVGGYVGNATDVIRAATLQGMVDAPGPAMSGYTWLQSAGGPPIVGNMYGSDTNATNQITYMGTTTSFAGTGGGTDLFIVRIPTWGGPPGAFPAPTWAWLWFNDAPFTLAAYGGQVNSAVLGGFTGQVYAAGTDDTSGSFDCSLIKFAPNGSEIIDGDISGGTAAADFEGCYGLRRDPADANAMFVTGTDYGTGAGGGGAPLGITDPFGGPVAQDGLAARVTFLAS